MKTIQQLIADELKRKEYRNRYNQRPEVKARQAAYMKTRNQEMRAVFQAFKDGRLAAGPTGGTRVDMGTGDVVDAEYEVVDGMEVSVQ